MQPGAAARWMSPRIYVRTYTRNAGLNVLRAHVCHSVSWGQYVHGACYNWRECLREMVDNG